MSLPTPDLLKNMKPQPYHEGFVSPGDLERILDKNIDSDTVQDLFTQGFELAQQDELEHAILVWDKVLDIEPDFVSAIYNQGVAYLELEQIENAQLKFERALQLDFNYTQARLNLGVALIALKQYNRAIANFEIILNKYPNLAQAWHNYGLALFELNHLEASIEKYNKALSIDSSRYLPHYCKGKALFFLDRLDEATQSYSTALKIQPDTPMALLSRGMVLARAGKYEQAINDFDKVIELDPSIVDSLVFHERSVALAELRQFHEALESITTFLQESPNLLPLAWYVKGILLIHLDRKTEAAQNFNKFLDLLEPDSDEIWLYKPAIYGYKGQVDKAFECLYGLVETDPRLFIEVLDKGGFDNLKDDGRLDELKLKAEARIKEILKEQGEILAWIEHKRKTDPAMRGLPDPVQIIREARDR
ncbi:Tetratricopeptide TPR_2 repeat-containing protein [Thalassoporum mexicanum PCC 7367]|uniref:tetratricopeptide repeat protein n=1 Tax=Thalassoporum mexicanum TaxID=3457544 RepID=UPI00029F81DD|nr:tetratricopeptide repeat protein [Pseudanabaena sp. PCC 7367]AFY70787.1 Tetratricopeptide TPR_2 repeat-containing protein [Pseudanabaena sp. PCC 7367]